MNQHSSTECIQRYNDFDAFFGVADALNAAIVMDSAESIANIMTSIYSPTTADLFDQSLTWEDEGIQHSVTPAGKALCLGSLAALDRILEFTKNPNVRIFPNDENRSLTLLMHAVFTKDLVAISLLLKHCADPSVIAIDDSGRKITVLGLAAAEKNQELLDLLISRGGKATAGDLSMALAGCENVSAIHSALLNSNPIIINDSVTESNNLLSIFAACNTNVTKWLIQNGADVNAAVTSGSPLASACGGGNLDAAKLLIQHGADLNAFIVIDGLRFFPLIAAYSARHFDVFRYLVERGADLNAPLSSDENNTVTLLDLAISDGHNDLAEFLVVHGLTTEQFEAAPGEKTEMTDCVERFEILEEKFGITLSALYAAVEHRTWLSPPVYQICINFDVLSPSGAALEQSFFLKATAYNDTGQAIGVASAFISNNDFVGFDSREMLFQTDQRPATIRLFPTK